MSSNPTSHKIKTIATLAILLCSATLLFAEQTCPKSTGNKGIISTSKTQAAPKEKLTPQEKKNLSNLQKEARMYREQGIKFQNNGDLDSAMGLYQKAIILDSTYADAYNDLGVIYEAKGFTDRAEESYLKCITIDPGYASAYTNLALLYEGKRDLKKAAYCWEKRSSLGPADDPWTKKAKQRLDDIRMVLSDKPLMEAKEKEVIGLLSDVSSKKALAQKENKELAKNYFNKAKIYYKKGDDIAALKTAIDASQLDPSNKEINEFVQKVQTRLLSK